MGKKKYIKYHKKKNIFKVEQSNLLTPKQGFYGLKAVTSGILSPNQLETARRIISKITKRSGKIVMKITFEHALTKKPLLSRMGKGIGSIHS
jgi:large subunit ribosomal protein L16